MVVSNRINIMNGLHGCVSLALGITLAEFGSLSVQRLFFNCLFPPGATRGQYMLVNVLFDEQAPQ